MSSMGHYTLARYLAREIAAGAIAERYPDGTVSSFELAADFRVDSTTALWALRLLAQKNLVEKIEEKSYGAEIYRIFAPCTTVKIPAITTPRNFLN